MRDAESVPDPGPGHALGAGFGDGDLDSLLQHGAEHAEVVETGLSVSEGGITLSPAESGDVIERGGIGAHRAPPPITEATTAHGRGVKGGRTRRSPAKRRAARAAAMTGSWPSSREDSFSL